MTARPGLRRHVGPVDRAVESDESDVAMDACGVPHDDTILHHQTLPARRFAADQAYEVGLCRSNPVC
jgi:hypothetical protein